MYEQQLQSFRSELKKIAWTMPKLEGALSGAGGGAFLGGVGGGLYKGYKGYRDARNAGMDVGESARYGLGQGLHGARTGVILGGLAGGAAGTLDPEIGARLSTVPGGQFLQRQVHGLTGWTPTKGLGSIGMGAGKAEKAVAEASAKRMQLQDTYQRAAKELHQYSLGDPRPEDVQQFLGPHAKAFDKAVKEEARLHHAAGLSRISEEGGLTSIPGIAKSMLTSPVDTVKHLAKEQWYGSDALGKGLMIGLPAYGLANAALRSDDPEKHHGMSKGEHIGQEAAGLAGGLLLGPVPLVSGMVAGTALSAGGKAVGGMLGGKPRPHLPNQSATDPLLSAGQTQPAERIMTPSYLGQAPDSVGA